MPANSAALLPAALVLLLTALTFVALAWSGRLGRWREEFPSAWRYAAGLLLAGILAVTVYAPTVSPGEAADVDPETIWFPSLFTGHLLLAIFLQAWWMLGWPMPLRRFLRLEGGTRDDVTLGLAVGAAGWVLALLASGIVTAVLYLIGWHSDLLSSGGDGLDVPPLMLWLAELPAARKLVVVAVAMTVEEAFYRGFLQPRVGWIPSSLLFALSHAGYGMPNLLASVLVISLAIGWAFRRVGNLVPCIVAHGLFDAVQLFVVMPLAVEQLRRLTPG
jgi:membrane protease YdiL (CAAX protease family)